MMTLRCVQQPTQLRHETSNQLAGRPTHSNAACQGRASSGWRTPITTYSCHTRPMCCARCARFSRTCTDDAPTDRLAQRVERPDALASRTSSIFLRRIIGSMFMRVNSKCAQPSLS